MQRASQQYMESMRKPLRNLGYIRAWVGVINSRAQASLEARDYNLAWFGSTSVINGGDTVSKIYATCEENFSKVDGSMYFMPENGENLYTQGMVTDALVGIRSLVFKFNNGAYDVKGFTIEFGDCYPKNFVISWRSLIDGQIRDYSKQYTNTSSTFVTEDTFYGIYEFIVMATRMVGGADRLRIYSVSCGVINHFTNDDIESFYFKDYASSISDSIPSQDLSLTVNNRNLYYCPDDPESILSFLEEKMTVDVQFGYDIDGNGTVEWIEPFSTLLSKWSANESTATFNAADIFYFSLMEEYQKGLYRPNGISLYDLAVDVFTDAGLIASEYYINPYLQRIKVKNPLPVTTHANCIQLIANAARGTILLDRGKRICVDIQFLPDYTVSSNSITSYSSLTNVFKSNVKTAYAETSNDFTLLSDSLLFAPLSALSLKDSTGYISDSVYFGDDENGYEWSNGVPQINVEFAATSTIFGMYIAFHNVVPAKFSVIGYREGAVVDTIVFDDNDLTNDLHIGSIIVDRLEIVFDEGYPNSRIFVDSISLNNTSNYRITRSYGLREDSPTAIRQRKVKSLTVNQNTYKYVTAKTLVDTIDDYYEYREQEIMYETTTAMYDVSVKTSSNPKDVVLDTQVVSLTPYRHKITYFLAGMDDEPIKTETVNFKNSKDVSIYVNNPSFDYRIDILEETNLASIVIKSSNERTVVVHVEAVYADTDASVKFVLFGCQKHNLKTKVYAMEAKSLHSGEIQLTAGTTVERVMIPKASYDMTVYVDEGTATATIIDRSSYFVDVRFVSGSDQAVKYHVDGFEFITDTVPYTKTFRDYGEAIQWDNPLIGDKAHAMSVESWLEEYYLGEVEYDFAWRGDPIIDADDLLWLEVKNMQNDSLIRAYQSELNFTGAWSGSIKARKVTI